MTLADISTEINCWELRATTRMPSGEWNLYCKRNNNKRTNMDMCMGCKKRQPIAKKEAENDL